MIDLPGSERRQSRRTRMLRCAELRVGDVIFDCVMLDSSEAGARVQTDARLQVSGPMELRLPDGRIIPVRRSWVQDMEIGLEFAGDAEGLSPEERLRARTAFESLCVGRLHHALRLLRVDQFYGDPALRRAVDAMDLAETRLKKAILTRMEPAAAAH